MITHQHAQSQPPARVVLLGAGGFIGTAVCGQLTEKNIPVKAPPSAELNLAETSAADKLAELLKPSDAVVMLAAITSRKEKDCDATIRINNLLKNLVIMQNVRTAIEKSDCAHLVYFSSDAVYNPAVSRVTEDTPACPQSFYGAMHCTREIMARSLARVPVLVLRPTMVYGFENADNSNVLNRFCRSAHKCGRIELSDGEGMRDHIHVDDVARLTVRCLLNKSIGTLNVATGISRSFYDVAKIVKKQFGNRIDINSKRSDKPITQRHYDVTNLIKAFPDFRFIAPEDGIARVHHQMIEAAR